MDNLTPYDFMPESENECMPPYCNTGAQHTSETGLIAVVDWLQVTFKNELTQLKIFNLLGLEKSDFSEINGLYGYKEGLTYNGIFIFYSGSLEMGVHLQITGFGCRFLEQFDNFDWVDFFYRISNFREYNITRLDIALDDFTGIFSIKDIIKKVKNGELVSKFKKAVRIETIDIGTGDSAGNTVYFGKPSSRLQIRMYEKNHERKNKGVDHDFNVWNRTELQLRKERAEKMFNIILDNKEEDFSNHIKGVLHNYLRFTNKRKDKNKSRWPTWHKWKKFIGEVEKIKLTISEPEKDLIDSYIHMEKQYSATLAMLNEVGIDLNELVELGKEKMKDKHYFKINEYKKRAHKGHLENSLI